MGDISKYVIRDTATVKDAIIALNSLSNDVLTLFVVNQNLRMIGSLTDGDIRRYLASDGELKDYSVKAAKKDFYFIRDLTNIYEFRRLREKGIALLPCLDANGEIVDVYNLKKYKSFLPMDAVLMAGGKGERLRPLTEKTPKPLLKIGGKAIIDYNVDRLLSYGVQNISVTINYLGEQLEDHFAELYASTKIKCVKEPNFLGTIGSVKLTKNFYNDSVLVMNSDLFTNVDYESFYLHFLEHDADMSVATIPYGINIPYGIFDLDGRNIVGVEEKPTYNFYANAGIYLIKKEILKFIPNDLPFDATDLIKELIEAGRKVIRFPLTGYWIDIGKKEDYAKAQEFVKHL